MVSHGTAKKRRSGSSKTKHKPQKRVQVRILRKLTNPEMKEKYDKKLTPVQLMESMGLVSDSNGDLKGKAKELKGSAFLGFAHILDEGDNFHDQNPKRKAISEFDCEYASKNIDKHGANYTKMAMDIITNDRQFSAKKMETLCTKYLSSLVK